MSAKTRVELNFPLPPLKNWRQNKFPLLCMGKWQIRPNGQEDVPLYHHNGQMQPVSWFVIISLQPSKALVFLESILSREFFQTQCSNFKSNFEDLRYNLTVVFCLHSSSCIMLSCLVAFQVNRLLAFIVATITRIRPFTE